MFARKLILPSAFAALAPIPSRGLRLAIEPAEATLGADEPPPWLAAAVAQAAAEPTDELARQGGPDGLPPWLLPAATHALGELTSTSLVRALSAAGNETPTWRTEPPPYGDAGIDPAFWDACNNPPKLNNDPCSVNGGGAWMPGPNAAYHSGIDCLRPDGAYTTDPNRHWKGTVTVAKHKCEEDPQCTTLYHDGDSGYGDTHVNWRACKSVQSDPSGPAVTLVKQSGGDSSLDGVCVDRSGYLLCQTRSHKQLLIEACKRKSDRDFCLGLGRCISPIPSSFCYAPSLEMAELEDCRQKNPDDTCEIRGPRNGVDAKGRCVLTATGTKLCQSHRRHRVLVASCSGLVPGQACSVFDDLFPGTCFKMPRYCVEEHRIDINQDNVNVTVGYQNSR